MAPEILRYEKYDAKADLWSVGAVLYEMCVGKPPFRAQNHVELLKKIEHSKGVKFPDEDPSRVSSNPSTPPTIKTEEPKLIAADIKDLIRALLRRQPAERASFEEFFKSKALAKSKFPRPAPEIQSHSSAQAEEEEIDEGQIPEHHRIIPPEVLDPKAMIPPSKFHFRRRDTIVDDVSAVPPARCAVFEVSCTFRSNNKSPTASPGRQQTATNHARIPTTPNLPTPVNARAAKRLAVEGSIIPGESEEDGLIRKEYVLVDPRAVEFTRAVDGGLYSLSLSL